MGRIPGEQISLLETLTQAARKEGFPVSGAVDFHLSEKEIAPHLRKYREWIESGHHASMQYLERGLDARLRPELLFPKAKSIFCVMLPYSTRPIGDENSEVRFARYLRGPDYHEVLKEKLARVMGQIHATHPHLEFKIAVDTSAVLERSWAALAGLGWIGKNTLLIHPKLGSYFFLGSVLLSEETGESPKPLPNFCGHCTRCLEACPTNAFLSPGELKSSRCISYETLEKKKGTPSDSILPLHGWVAGCDRCQEVCPFNEKRVKLESDCITDSVFPLELKKLRSLTESNYREMIRHSALSRVKYEKFQETLSRMTLEQIKD